MSKSVKSFFLQSALKLNTKCALNKTDLNPINEADQVF